MTTQAQCLLENGHYLLGRTKIDLRYIQELLEHKNYKITVGGLKSQLDNLNLKQKAMCGEICQKVRNDGLSARDGIYEILRIYRQFESINELVRL